MPASPRIPGWPKITLTEPPYVKRFTGPAWEDFPQGLRDDIDAYCERIGKRHKTTSGKIFRHAASNPPSTCAGGSSIAAVRAAVAAGIPLEELKSLRDLLRPDRVETLIGLLLGEERREALALHHRSCLQAAGARPQRGPDPTVEIERIGRNQNRPRAISLYRSHREEPEAHPPNRPERRVAGGGAASPKADGRGPHQR